MASSVGPEAGEAVGARADWRVPSPLSTGMEAGGGLLGNDTSDYEAFITELNLSSALPGGAAGGSVACAAYKVASSPEISVHRTEGILITSYQ